jgi:hypothetical protein
MGLLKNILAATITAKQSVESKEKLEAVKENSEQLYKNYETGSLVNELMEVDRKLNQAERASRGFQDAMTKTDDFSSGITLAGFQKISENEKEEMRIRKKSILDELNKK